MKRSTASCRPKIGNQSRSIAPCATRCFREARDCDTVLAQGRASEWTACARRMLALRSACAVELVHVASLVHDDLPCFDDAALRKVVRPYTRCLAKHERFGRRCAARTQLRGAGWRTSQDATREALRVVQLLACATGSLSGLVGGQELEQESALGSSVRVPESAASYHEMKTGALFETAAHAGAIAAGSNPDSGLGEDRTPRWQRLSRWPTH